MSDKLFWVALPLLAFAATMALLAWWRRLPSRRALNAWSSVLLLAYLLSTAGLGIFWVANQQLPVFDWHYLFGYGTVVLATLHLVLNFGSVWRYFSGWLGRRPAPVAARAAVAAPSPRRGWLGAAGALLAAGLAFALGMRHGRSDFRIDAAPAGAGDGGGAISDPGALALVERFHAFSSHSRSGVLTRAPGAEWRDPPPSFKRPLGGARRALPASPGGAAPPDGAPALAQLGAALWHTAGITERRGGLELRASPSSGALFSTELYVAARAVPGLDPGPWHYDPRGHALERLAETPIDDASLGAPGEPGLHGALAVVVATAVFSRTGHKYRDRTYRYVLADLGHALENLRAAARASGLQAEFVAAFDEARVAATLRLDEAQEGVLALVALHAAPPQRAGLQAASPQRAAPPARPPTGAGHWRTMPLPARDRPGPVGVTAGVHAATSLRAGSAAAAPAASTASAAASRTAGARALPLPPARAVATPANALALIAARRSVRRFADRPVPLNALAGVLAAATAGPPALSPAVRIDVVAHAVAGLAPGAYRHDAVGEALSPRRAPVEMRAAARAAALDQDVIGACAAVLVLSIDRAVFAADPLGPARGYRHAFIEAGLVGERVYLEAGARGLATCGVGAFYDDEAAALVGLDPGREWVVHFAALGVPAA